MDFTLTIVALITAFNFLLFNISSTNAQRFGRPKHCKKPCNQKFDCTSENRECLKDGDDCGKSCVNRCTYYTYITTNYCLEIPNFFFILLSKHILSIKIVT